MKSKALIIANKLFQQVMFLLFSGVLTVGLTSEWCRAYQHSIRRGIIIRERLSADALNNFPVG